MRIRHVDLGGEPAGWGSFTKIQKEWVLSKAKRCEKPCWYIVDDGVPNEFECLKDIREWKRSADTEILIMLTAMGATALVFGLFEILYLSLG